LVGITSTQREDDTRAKQSDTNKDSTALGVDDDLFQKLISIFEQRARLVHQRTQASRCMLAPAPLHSADHARR
jgi:hypothetical protein